jgi:hypothetical protein
MAVQHRVNMSSRMLFILILCLASVALADDFKTIDGKEYINATVSRVEPDGIVLITKIVNPPQCVPSQRTPGSPAFTAA